VCFNLEDEAGICYDKAWFIEIVNGKYTHAHAHAHTYTRARAHTHTEPQLAATRRRVACLQHDPLVCVVDLNDEETTRWDQDKQKACFIPLDIDTNKRVFHCSLEFKMYYGHGNFWEHLA
jgi:hypothetical protein